MKLVELKVVKFRFENVYRLVFLASLASSLMKTAFPCTIFIARATVLKVRTFGASLLLLFVDK